MVKVVLIYGSTTGNTEALSEHVAAGLERGMAEVTVKDVAKASVDELANYVYFFHSEAEKGKKIWTYLHTTFWNIRKD